MRHLIVLFAVLVVCASLVPDSRCPAQCRCTLNSSGGTVAHCSFLDAAEQQFSGNIQRLEVSNTGSQDEWITSLEDRLFMDLGLSSLDSIKITNTSLSNVDINAFRGLSNLYDLDLSNNHITSIDPDTFEFSPFLHRLVLAGNPLKPDVNKYFLKSESITELDISRCNLSRITPEMFSKFETLIFLNLASNNLKDIGHFWNYKDFEFVEELDLSDNQIRKIDTHILSEHTEMVTLNLRKNLLDSFDNVEIQELEDLDLSQNIFKKINANTFINIPEVIQVNLSHNQIHSIAEDSFIHAVNLKNLDLSHNNIKGPLPVYMLTKNQDIETLILTGNRNMKIFTGEEGLSGEHNVLYTLDISDCGLEVIKSNSFKRMDNIASLNLSTNAIRILDADVFSKLKHLSSLDISNNQLLTLNTSLFSRNNELKHLVVSGNPLINFSPKLFMNVQQLHYLDASYCQLKELWSFRDVNFLNTYKILGNLDSLILSNNNIKHFHINDLVSAQSLTTVDIRNNPMSCTKHFTELIQWFVTQKIDPEKQRHESFDDKENSFEWAEVIRHICPLSSDSKKNMKPFTNGIGSDIIKVIEETSSKNEYGTENIETGEKLTQPFKNVIGSDVVKVVEESSTKQDVTTKETAQTDKTLTLLIPGVDLDDIFSEKDSSVLSEDETNKNNEELLHYYNMYGWIYWTFVLFVVVLLLAIINLTSALCCRLSPARPSYIGPVGGYVRTKNDGGSLYYKLYEETTVPIAKKKTIVLDFNQLLKKPNDYNRVKDIDALPSQV